MSFLFGQRKRSESQPKTAIEHYNLGVDYAHKNRDKEAIREFKEALNIDPQYAQAHYAISTIYFSQRRIEEGIRELEMTLNIDPNHIEAHFNLGWAYLIQNKGIPDDKSIHEFEEVVRLDPNRAEAHLALAVGYTRKGRWETGYREGELAEKLGCSEATEWLLKGTDRLIDNMQSLFLKFASRSGDSMNTFDELMELVSVYLYAIDTRFFNRLGHHIAQAQGKRRDILLHMRGLLFTALSNIVGTESLERLIALTDNPQLTEHEIEAYLEQAEKKSHFVFYVVVLGFLKRMHEFADVHKEYDPNARRDAINMQKIIEVASRLAPEAVPVAEQYYQSAEDLPRRM